MCVFITVNSYYILLYSLYPGPSDNNEWYSKFFTNSRGTMTNLKSEKKYVFKAAASSSEAHKMGVYDFSNPVEMFVP